MPQLTYFRSPGTVIARFVARRTTKSATVWAYIIGAYVASKSLAFAKAFPTTDSRLKIAKDFSNNVGLNALLGQPHHLETIGGYTNWNTLSVVTIIGSIWALTLATRYFRGEEDSGRSELLLTGPTTQRRAAINVLAGMSLSLLVQYLLVAIIFVVIGKQHSVGFSVSSSLFFGLASVCGAAMFLAIGALASQIMPTRSRATALAIVIFGVSFLVRAMADITTMHWLLNLTPLGWIEKLQPLYISQPVWLLPIFGLVIVCAGLTIYLAGRRDLGDSLLADRDSAQPRTRLLNSPLGAALRFTRGSILSWLTGITLAALFYGLLTKTAAQAFTTITKHSHAQRIFSNLTHTSQLAAGTAFLGVVFLILTPMIMSCVASFMNKVREDEAQGYLDNFLVGPVSRVRWLSGRLALIIGLIVLVCMGSGAGIWLGQASQHVGVAFHSLILAGINVMAPAVFILGAATLTLGFVPRLTSLVAYCVIGWSFLIFMLGSGLHLSHWLLDSSLLQHLSLAPAVKPNWTTDLIIGGLGLLLTAAGVWQFNRRDLQSE